MTIDEQNGRSAARRLRWAARYGLHYLRCQWQRREPSPIIGRYACLGADVLKLLQPSQEIRNVQKGRVDYLADCWERPQRRSRTWHVVPHMAREEILDLVLKNELMYDWLEPRRPVALFMDSMAELGDQLFVHRDQGWGFLSAYTDLTHSADFAGAYRSEDLLPVEQLEAQFRRFFTGIRARFGAIPIFYLHFPATLDDREKFKQRHKAIREAADRIAPEFQPFYSLAVDDELVDWDEDRTPEMWSFPYHYNRRTYEAFAQMVRDTGVFGR